MEINDIRETYLKLSTQLKLAVSKMELSDKIFTIRNEINDLQKLCPHNSGTYDFSTASECPYCGKRFKGE